MKTNAAKFLHALPAGIRFLVAASLAGTPAPAASPAPATVVINEVMFHPPDDRDELQWVELLNPGQNPVQLQGWSLRKGLKFSFTNALELPAGGTVILSRDRGAFITHYGTNAVVLGDVRGRLKHGQEALELADSQGRTVDAMEYGDRTPWPVSPDGEGPSLERISPGGSGTDPANWAPSPMPRFKRAAGTPGQPNASSSENIPPQISSPQVSPYSPGKPTTVTFEVSDPDGVKEVRLAYQVQTANTAGNRTTAKAAPTEVVAARTQGDERAGHYSAQIPALPEGEVVRFFVSATDSKNGVRITPHPSDSRPSWSYFSGVNTNDARIPFAFLVQAGANEAAGASLRNPRGGRPGRGGATDGSEPARGDSTLVYFPTGGGPVQVFDYIRITPRQGGWKVRLQKDQLVEGMSTVNVLFEFQPRYVLSEYLSYELYRAAGVPAPLTGHWRVWLNGLPLGYHLTVEQPNASFLRRNQLDGDGSLFKLLWYGNGLIGQHEKKNHPETGHNDLVRIVNELGSRKGAAQWQLIEQNFVVDECARYYAVNMCLQNWDGFFNNYFVYRSPGPQGKWQIIPWDEDKTWGDYDGASPRYDWYTLPLNFGAGGDSPSGSMSDRFGGGPWGGASWWRPPGWFSGPLLGNPQFRTRFRTLLRELCTTTFTPEKFGPVIAELEKNLEPEVRYRARLGRWEAAPRGGPRPAGGRDPLMANAAGPLTDAAVSTFQRHLDSFRQQLVKRRQFILEQLAKDP